MLGSTGKFERKIIHVIQNKWLPAASSSAVLVSLSGANRIRVFSSSIVVVMLSTVGLTSLLFLCFIYHGIFSSPVQNSGIKLYLNL